MTSSGTYNFGMTNALSIVAAYERLQIFAPSLRNEHFATAARELNLAFANASNKQVNLWKVDLLSVPMVAGVVTYTLPVTTLMILDAVITTTYGGVVNDRYITPMSRTEYATISNKGARGQPTQYWFDRLITPTVTMYPTPDQSTIYTLNMYRCIPIQDANVPGGETPDLPVRWEDWLVAELAYRCSRVYKPQLEAQRKIDAKEAWETAAAFDVENANLSITPPIGNYYP
jgi:hypothetical protein